MEDIMQEKEITKVITNVFPCKSLNLLRFLKENGLQSELKYTDAKDNRDCWVFLRTDKLHELLTEWGNKSLEEKQNIKLY
jgi:hypothetical protein